MPSQSDFCRFRIEKALLCNSEMGPSKFNPSSRANLTVSSAVIEIGIEDGLAEGERGDWCSGGFRSCSDFFEVVFLAFFLCLFFSWANRTFSGTLSSKPGG